MRLKIHELIDIIFHRHRNKERLNIRLIMAWQVLHGCDVTMGYYEMNERRAVQAVKLADALAQVEEQQRRQAAARHN